MNDDRQHDYVPQIAPGVLDARLQVKDLELRELKADLRQAQRDATDRLIERNNLTEALRQVNARLAQMTKELVFLGSIAHFMPEPGLSLLRPTATPAALKLQAHIVRLWRLIETADGEREAANAMREAWEVRATAHFDRLESCEAELAAARQSRKRAVGQSRMWKTAAYLRWVDAESWRARAEVCQEERDKEYEGERNAAMARNGARLVGLENWKARAEKCEAERALSQSMREDDRR